MLLLWILFEVSISYVSQGLTIIDPNHSQLAAKGNEQEQIGETNIYDYDNHNTNNDELPAIDVNIDDIDDPSYHNRLLHHHMINSLDPLDDSDELNEQISILSQKQHEENQERIQHLAEVVKFLQTSLPLSETEHIHTLLQDIVSKTINNNNHNSTESLADLEILRDYLHQIDNAIDFGKMGGLSIMLQLVLEYPFIEVRTSAAWTIGLACQNNPTLMEYAHNISTVQNILYLLKVSSPNSDNTAYPRINLFEIDNLSHLSKLIWTLSSLTRQNDESYQIFKQNAGSDIMYEWVMEVYNHWNANKNHPKLLSENYKNKAIEKVLMFASDVVVLSPDQNLFIDDKWCDVMAAHFNYAQQHFQLREITLAYWDVAINQFFCLNCIPFKNNEDNIENDHLSIDIGLRKLMKMEPEDEFDLEMKSKATHLMNLIKNTHIPEP